jgi:ectoine hydroxylase-related dioxygenase (phytanoyl-CoA dioxygenase family)
VRGDGTFAENESSLRFNPDGAERREALLTNADLGALRALADATETGRPGVRVFGRDSLNGILGADGSIGRLAAALLGKDGHPVRAIVFDKTPEINWSVPWHQDRTIAVRVRRDVPGFGPWSIKAGIVHVEPPFEIMAGMITIRAHLDDCGTDNAPLLIVPGSHRFGRVPAVQAAETARRVGHAVCCARAGDVWAYATPVIHASERARTPSRRRVLQVDYADGQLPGGLEWLGIA